MPENHTNVDNIQEGMVRVKIERGEDTNKEYPERAGEADCIYYLRTGRCGYASTCRFNHPRRPPQSDDIKSELPQREGHPDCGYFLRTGTCKYGSTCKYHHPLDKRAKEVSLNSFGLPLREEQPCPYYLRTRKCKYGPACKFDHPQSTSVESALPVSGANTGGTQFSLPSTGIPYVGGGPLPAWSARFPTPQAYMPYFMPPLQGHLATQNWNSYLGNMSSMAATGVMGTDLVYNPMNPGELVNVSTMAISNLPERPDQPECRYFMSNGGCKYGLNCQFNHPKGRISHSIGPHGLPLRPSEDVCGHFSQYGMCKFGPSCKYNHPITGYIPSYYYGMPSIPYLNQPFFPSPRNAPVVPNTSESSPSKSNITDWIQKPDTVGSKTRLTSPTKSVQVSEEKVDDQSISVTIPTAEIPRDESD